MRLGWFGCGLILAGLLAGGCAATRAPEFPAPKSYSREASDVEAPVRVLELRVEYVFDEKGNWEERYKRRYRIENREGVDEWGAVGITWAPWYMARPRLNATVQDPDGNVRELDPETIAESAQYPDVPSVYSDGRLLRAPLPGVRVGSIVTETTNLRTTRPFFGGGSSFEFVFQNMIPRDRVELVLDLPESSPLNLELLDVKVERTETTKNGRRRIVFSGKNYGAVEGVDYFAPYDMPPWPAVAFSTVESWRSVAREYSAIVEQKLAGNTLDELARRTIQSSASDLDKANELLAAVRERVRYTSVSFGQAAIVPAAPEESLKRAYGDCKDQSLLLVGLLRAAGLPARLALLRTGPGEDVRPKIPALDVFNHAIVVIPGERPIWIDPTSDFARAGELPGQDQGRLALVIGDDTEGLTLTPTSSAADNTYLEAREVRMAELGSSTLVETSTATGLLEQRMRSSLSGTRDDVKKMLSTYAKDEYGGTLAANRVGNVSDLRQKLDIQLDVKDTSVGDTDLFSAWHFLDYGALWSWLPDTIFEEEPRKFDLRLPQRYRAEVRYKVVPPRHFEVKKLPTTEPYDLGPAKLERRFRELPGGVVEATFRFELDEQQLSPAELSRFRKGYQAWKRGRRPLVEFEHTSERLIREGKTREALELYESHVRAEPKSQAALLRFSLTLADMGFSVAARELARRAVALDPSSAVAQRSLGVALRQDELGRYLQPGYDREGALDAFNRAIALDADDTYSRIEQAVIYEHDELGRRYGNPQDLERAVAVYDAIPEDVLASYEGGGYRHNALYALLYGKRYDELARRLSKMEPAETPVAIPVSLAAMRRGPESAIAEADRFRLKGADRAAALEAAAKVLQTERRFGEAAKLFEAADGAEESLRHAMAATLARSLDRVETAELKKKSPELAAQRAFYRTAGLPLTVTVAPNWLEAVLASRARRDDLTTSIELFATALAKDRIRGKKSDTTKDPITSQLAGNDNVGYRVRLKAGGLFGSSIDYFVLKEGGRYLVRAGGRPSAVGCEALYQLDRKNEKMARQWLTWAVESVDAKLTGDPLRFDPFIVIWADGKGEPELAAAALCRDSAGGRRSLDLLLAARGRAGVDATALEHAVTLAAESANDQARLLEASERLLSLQPSSEIAENLRLGALERSGRGRDHERLLRRRVERRAAPGPQRTEALLSLAAVEQQLGDVVSARRTYQIVIGEAEPGSEPHARANANAAWSGLFMSPRPANLLDQARTAEKREQDDLGTLTTLACVYLELGLIGDAERVFKRMRESRDFASLSATSPEQLFMAAAFAEAYGVGSAARVLYERIEAPPRASVTSVFELARKHLQALDGKRAK